jgi:hypothetical protein
MNVMLIEKMPFYKCWIGRIYYGFNNSVVNMLTLVCEFYRDLEEAEDQYQMALRTHLLNMDTIIKLHDSRLYSLERNFQQELRTVQADFLQEKEVLLQKFTKEKRELAAIIEAIETEEENKSSDVSSMSLNVYSTVLYPISSYRRNMRLNNFVKK